MSEAQTKEQLRAQINKLVAEYGALASVPKPFRTGRDRDAASRQSGRRAGNGTDGGSLAGRLADHRPLQRPVRAKLAKLIGVNFLITVNSGSSANLVAFSALTSPKLGPRAIQPGDEVIGVAAASRPPSTRSSSSARCRCSSTSNSAPTTST
jgi:CDP-6-deoxy-D-xylo-4-hexulose-3-dehydrase